MATILMVGMILAAAVYPVSMVLAFKAGALRLIAVNTAAFAATIFIFFNRRLAYPTRALGALLICYTIGVGVMVSFGVFSGGPAWLFAFTVLSGLLLGVRAAAGALAINAVTLLVIGWLAQNGYLAGSAGLPVGIARSMVAWANYVLLNAVTAFSASVLVRGLQETADSEKAATAILQKEREKLIQTREVLKNEIDARKETEKALRIIEFAVNHSGDSAFWFRPDTRITKTNTTACKSLGYAQEEMLRLTIADIDPTFRADKWPAYWRLLKERGAFIMESLQRTKAGVVFPVEISINYFQYEGEEYGCAFVRDISDRKKARREKEQLQEKLARSKKMEALGLLAGGVAHDLNNVLSGIVSYPDLILMDLAEDNPIRKPVETMKESGQKAATIVQDLLALARRGAATTEIVNLNDIIRDYLASPELEKTLGYHPDVRIETELEENLPNIRGSVVHLRKSIMNMVVNAAEAQPDGGRIIVSTESIYLDQPVKGYENVSAGEYIRLAIRDFGEGIDAEDLPRIFEPFYTKKVMGRSGSGLGMAVVWGTVQDHKGYVDAESSRGKGTTFTLYFPMTRESIQVQDDAAKIDEYSGNGESILVIDDMADQREIVSNMLRRLNYTAATAASGEEAIEYLQNADVALVILDMIMEPGMDGLETFRKILEIHPRQKAVIASGYSETDRVQQALRLGAGRYIKKPYTLEAIGLAIKDELKKQRG